MVSSFPSPLYLNRVVNTSGMAKFTIVIRIDVMMNETIIAVMCFVFFRIMRFIRILFVYNSA